jgi:next-to-BRCA1 protein 1
VTETKVKQETSVPSPKNQDKVVHEGIVCDGCQASPIVGVRFKCTACPDFDFCEKCEGSKWHPAGHAMMKIKVPVKVHVHVLKPQNPPASEHIPVLKPATPVRKQSDEDKQNKPAAEFIKDVTVQDHESVEANSVVRKIWAVKNTGSTVWPEGCTVVYVDGAMLPEKKDAKIPLPLAKPGETVDVVVEIRAPATLGRAFGNYRLATPTGVRFGPKIWIDVQVIAKPVPAPVASVSANKPASPAQPVKQDDKKTEKAEPKKADSPKSQPNKAEEKPKEEKAAPVKRLSVELAKYKYQTELSQLKDMGYSDDELLMYLLGKNKGDVQACVEWLVRWNKGGK